MTHCHKNYVQGKWSDLPSDFRSLVRLPPPKNNDVIAQSHLPLGIARAKGGLNASRRGDQNGFGSVWSKNIAQSRNGDPP